MDVVRSVIFRIESWMIELASGKHLVTISKLGMVERSRTRAEVLQMMEERAKRTSEQRIAEED